MEKIDVLDLLIEILMNHEKRIDELVARLELLVDHLDVDVLVSELDFDDSPSDIDAKIKNMK